MSVWIAMSCPHPLANAPRNSESAARGCLVADPRSQRSRGAEHVSVLRSLSLQRGQDLGGLGPLIRLVVHSSQREPIRNGKRTDRGPVTMPVDGASEHIDARGELPVSLPLPSRSEQHFA